MRYRVPVWFPGISAASRNIQRQTDLPSDLEFLERTTGFEPATLTLATQYAPSDEENTRERPRKPGDM